MLTITNLHPSKNQLHDVLNFITILFRTTVHMLYIMQFQQNLKQANSTIFECVMVALTLYYQHNFNIIIFLLYNFNVLKITWTTHDFSVSYLQLRVLISQTPNHSYFTVRPKFYLNFLSFKQYLACSFNWQLQLRFRDLELCTWSSWCSYNYKCYSLYKMHIYINKIWSWVGHLIHSWNLKIHNF